MSTEEITKMNNNIYGYGNPYNPQVLRDLEEIKKEMEDELKNGEPDKEKMLELKQRQLLKGMALQTDMMNGRTYRGMNPW